MRACRPSRFGECEMREREQMEDKEARMTLYQRLAEHGAPLFDERNEFGRWPEVHAGHDADRQETGYRLRSECLDTGRVTMGQYTFASLEAARAVAIAMDALWPNIRHRAVPAREVPAEGQTGTAGERRVFTRT